jgi:hypothetical protein
MHSLGYIRKSSVTFFNTSQYYISSMRKKLSNDPVKSQLVQDHNFHENAFQ